jgi:hypothetical protein
MTKQPLSNLTAHMLYWFTTQGGTILHTFTSRDKRDTSAPKVCEAGNIPSHIPVTYELAEEFADLPQFDGVIAHFNHC